MKSSINKFFLFLIVLVMIAVAIPFGNPEVRAASIPGVMETLDDFYCYVRAEKEWDLGLSRSSGSGDPYSLSDSSIFDWVPNNSKYSSDIWHFVSLGNGIYRIYSAYDDRVLASNSSNRLVIQNYSDSNYQKWRVYKETDNTYVFQNVYTGNVIDSADHSGVAKAYSNAVSQYFFIENISGSYSKPSKPSTPTLTLSKTSVNTGSTITFSWNSIATGNYDLRYYVLHIFNSNGDTVERIATTSLSYAYTVPNSMIGSCSADVWAINGNYTDTSLRSASAKKSFTVNVPISSATISGISDKTYTGSALTQSVKVVLDSKTLVSGTDYSVTYSNNTNVGTATVTITGKGNYSGTITKTFSISEKSISSSTLSISTNLIYSGYAKYPVVSVYLDSKYLIEDTDFVTYYFDNVDAGTATVKVVGTGNYIGTLYIDFTILPKEIEYAEVTGIVDKTYTGNAKSQDITVELSGKKLVSGTDYTVSYSDNVNVGTATVTITGKGNYTGSITRTFDIAAKSIKDVTVTGIVDKTYTGNAKSQDITIEVYDKTLVLGTDYKVSYSNNVNAGIATVTITGIGNYTDTIEKTFNIAAKSIKDATVTGIVDKTYTGNAKSQDITVELSGKKLVSGTDYTVSYSDNVNAGTATVIINGKGNYAGTVKKTFNIAAKSIKDATVTGIVDKTYTGNAKSQDITVELSGKKLVSGTDYTVSYSDNVDAGTATVTITGKGDYAGTIKKTFNIAAKSIKDATVTGIVDKTYTGNAKSQDVTVELSGKKLVSGTDYTVSYSDNVNIGTATVTITGKGNYAGSIKKTFNISAMSIKDATVTGIADKTYTGKAITQKIKVILSGKELVEGTDYSIAYTNNQNVGTATLTITGKGIYSGTITNTFKISAKDIKDFTVSGITDKKFTGKSVTQSVTLKNGSKTLTAGTDYSLTYSNNTKIGTATLKIEGIGNYTGSISKKFVIYVDINSDVFPDSNFRDAVSIYDTDSDGRLVASEIDKVTKIICNGNSIKSLKGIEVFYELQVLHCYNNELTSIDVTMNKKLTTLYCDNNQLSSINLSKNNDLQFFTCANNNISSLSLGNTALANSELNYKPVRVNDSNLLCGFDEERYQPIHYMNCNISYRKYLLIVDENVELDFAVVLDTNSGVEDFAERLYTTCLGRDAEEEGKEYWAGELKNGRTGAEIAEGFFFSQEFIDSKLSNSEFVIRLYRTFMGREPDQAGVDYWNSEMNNGKSRKFVFDGFINSPEWADICLDYGIRSGGLAAPTYEKEASESVKAFAERLYTTCLGREADVDGLEYWSQELANLRQTGTVAAGGFFFSEEFVGLNLNNRDYVTRLYRTFMGREPDEDGYNYWLKEMENGKSRRDVFDGFSFAPEFAELCANAGIMR